MSTPTYDGDWTVARQDGPTVITWERETYTHIFKKKFKVLAANYSRTAMDTAIDETFPFVLNGVPVLVDESEPSAEDCGVVTFERTFAEPPATRDEFIGYVHNSQYGLTIDGTFDILEYARQCTARVHFEYFNTTSPGSITYNRAYKLVKIGTTVYNTGGPNPGFDVERVAEDSTIERWQAFPRSNFYVRRTLYVNQPGITVRSA